MEGFKICMLDPIDVDGRIRRRDYWNFILWNVVIYFVLGFLIGCLKVNQIAFLAGIYSFWVAIAFITATINRLHDIGRSGFWWLIGFVPFVGPVVLLIVAFIDSEPGTNKYGPNPKGE